MSVMSDLHATLLQLVADAESGANGFCWIWVPDTLDGEPGAEIRVLTAQVVPFHSDRRTVRVWDWDLVVAQNALPSGDCRTIDGAVVRVGDSVRIFDAEAHRDFEICTVSDALGVFA
jgi:hypothetical protein